MAEANFIVKRESAELLHEFSAELPDDEYSCRLHSVLTLEDGNIVVVDFNNKRLKLFSQRGEFLNSAEFEYYPRRACLTPTKDIIVTMKGVSQLAFVQYIDQQLLLTDMIQTDKEYIDIDAIDHKRLAVNMCGYIDVINYDGKVLNRINHYVGEGTEGLRVKFPSSLKARNNLLYTTEIRHNGDRGLGLQCMVCCDLFGKTIFVYNGPKDPLLFPCGVTHDKYGNIYIACRVTSRIYRVDPSGCVDHLLLSKANGLSQPWCMWVTDDMRLVLTEYESSIVRIFEV